ncbi:MAG: hypothetical protein AAFX87_21845 [Bacteroidota bacterium]
MSTFQKVIDEGYYLDIGKSMSDGWELFKKGASSFIGFTVIFIVILIIISEVMEYVPVPLVGSFISDLLLACLTAGFFVFAFHLTSRQEDFGQFFEGFQDIAQLGIFQIVYNLIQIPILIIITLLIIPWELFLELSSGGITDLEYFLEEMQGILATEFVGRAILGIFLAAALSIYIGISYSLVIPLITLGKLSFWEAMETSRKVTAQKFFTFFGLYLIMGLIVGIGTLITCLLGIIVLIPFYFCTVYAVYTSIFKEAADQGPLTGELDMF